MLGSCIGRQSRLLRFGSSSIQFSGVRLQGLLASEPLCSGPGTVFRTSSLQFSGARVQGLLASRPTCSGSGSASPSSSWQYAFRFVEDGGACVEPSAFLTTYLELCVNLPLLIFLTFWTWSRLRTGNSSVLSAFSLARFFGISCLYALLPFLGLEAGI